MIEGGGLGIHEPTSIGPIDVQRANGVVDIVVRRRGRRRRRGQALPVVLPGPARRMVVRRTGRPACRRAGGSPARLRRPARWSSCSSTSARCSSCGATSALGVVTALARLEGRPVGVLANNPRHLGGAIDSPAADKAARFMQLCDAFDLPLVTLVDTPGMMVGPDVEATALVRHCNRLFVTGANLTIPTVAVVLRKAYGLGAQAMMGGSTKAPLGCFAWPTSEFGGMGLEGAVRLGYRRELDAAADDTARQQLFDELVARAYEIGKGISVASYFEIDDVIDPADTRRYLAALLDAAPPPPPRKKRPTSTLVKRPANIDTSGDRSSSLGSSAAEHRHPLLLRRRLEHVVLLADRRHRGARGQRVAVAGEHDRAVGQGGEALQAVVHRRRRRRRGDRCVRSRRGTACRRRRGGRRRAGTGSPACARACAAARRRSRRRARRRPGRWVVSSSGDTPIVRDTHGASAACTWTGTSTCSSSGGDALDRVAHHRSTDVIRVVVRGDHAGDVHAVGGDGGEQFGDGVGRVDEDALAGRPVADGVHEVDHLGGERVVDGEVATAQQLAEVQPILDRPSWWSSQLRTLRWPREHVRGRWNVSSRAS